MVSESNRENFKNEFNGKVRVGRSESTYFVKNEGIKSSFYTQTLVRNFVKPKAVAVLPLLLFVFNRF